MIKEYSEIPPPPEPPPPRIIQHDYMSTKAVKQIVIGSIIVFLIICAMS